MQFTTRADDASEAGPDIAVAARSRVMQRQRVPNPMTQLDGWRRPDLNHAPVNPKPAGQDFRWMPPLRPA